MSSTIDQKRLFNRIKHDLEGWRELILMGNSILKWEKKIYPAIIFGTISTIFLFLWYLDLSALTLISLLLLDAVLFDHIFVIISKLLFKPEDWTAVHENKFEEVCNEICRIRTKLYSYTNMFFTAKEQKSTAFVITVTITLLLLAWIGSVVDNFLLSYIATLIIFMYPGLQRHGFINTFKGQFGNIISLRLQQLKEKAINVKSD